MALSLTVISASDPLFSAWFFLLKLISCKWVNAVWFSFKYVNLKISSDLLVAVEKQAISPSSLCESYKVKVSSSGSELQISDSTKGYHLSTGGEGNEGIILQGLPASYTIRWGSWISSLLWVTLAKTPPWNKGDLQRPKLCHDLCLGSEWERVCPRLDPQKEQLKTHKLGAHQTTISLFFFFQMQDGPAKKCCTLEQKQNLFLKC